MKHSKPVILYLDDEKRNLVIARNDLEEDFEVIGFETPAALFKEIENIEPCIVLSDLRMPTMSGVEFLELIQQIFPNAIRVMITGNSDEQSVIEAIRRARIFNFIKKPFKGNELQAIMLLAHKQYLEDEINRANKIKLEKPDLMEHPSWLHKISEQLELAFKALPQCQVSHRQIEEWSLLIHLAMSAEKRYYHNTQHLFDIWDVSNPYERLAILFHDVVYAQVDQNSGIGMLTHISDILKPLIPDQNLKLSLPSLSRDITTSSEVDDFILYQVFGFKGGEILTPTTGMNEFLSARVAQKILGTVLSVWEVIRVLACIELTIPFRHKDKQGHSAPQRLFQRLEILNTELSKMKLGLKSIDVKHQTTEEIEKTVSSAVNMTNRDLWSFGAKDPGDFLNGSWQLIIEGNIPLQKELHSPKDYRTALEKMEGFLNHLNPELIFQKIKDFPSEKDYSQLLTQAQFNLEAGRKYFQAKILSMGILEALNYLTGGNAPIETFRGDIESESNSEAEGLEAHLDYKIPVVSVSEINPTVLELLKVKSKGRIRYDLKNSPLACYLYERLTKSEFDALMKLSRLYFKQELDAFELLKAYPKILISATIQAVSEISKSRRTLLMQIGKLLLK